MTTSVHSNHRQGKWGLFLTVMVASMCGAMLGDFLMEQPDSYAAQGTPELKFGTYSPIEEEPGGAYSQVMETEVPIAQDSRLIVRNANGKTSVEVWDRPNLWIRAKKQVSFPGEGFLNFLGLGSSNGSLVEAKKGLDRVEVRIEQTPEETEIKTVVSDSSVRMSASVDYEILIPAQMNLEVHSANGKIEVKGLVGEVTANSVNGKVVIEEVGGPVEVVTTNGKFEADGIDGILKAETINGKIEARRITGGADLKTLNGGIQLEIVAPLSATDSVRCKTQNGSIGIHLPQSSSFHVDLESHHGSVETDFPLSETAARENHRIEGEVGSGGGSVQARAANGSIRVNQG